MFVQKVEFLRLRAPSRNTHLLVRIGARNGVTGWGECGPATRDDVSLAMNTLIGRPASAYEWVARSLAAAPGIEAGVIMALLDIVARTAKAPLYQVLGGPTRNKARAIVRIGGGTDDEIVLSMKRMREAGHRAFLVNSPDRPFPNSGQSFVNAVTARIDKLRAAAGAECDFALDGESLTAGDAASAASALERRRLLWLDSPSSAPADKIAETVTPLGFGPPFLDRLRDGTVDVLRPSLQLLSLARIRKAAALAETYYVAVAPRHDGTPVATAAGLHLAASLPNFFAQQIPVATSDEERAFRAALGGAIETVRDGYAALPTGPGLGITIDEKALEPFVEARG